ncbi:MAG: ABC transporter substrate-binding protein [Oscillospiraceae bacterium]|nr:ABC transporter substrate-binding protein [Oscillospiraceae bacterium]
MKRIFALALALCLTVAAAGCAVAPSAAPAQTAQTTQDAAETAGETTGETPLPELPGLTVLSAMEKVYATQFDVYYCEGGYKYLAIGDGNAYLLVPEGKEAPAGLDPSVRVLHQPLDSVYLAATGAMSLFDAMNALDVISLTSQDASDWYVEGARAAMERGEILYGGKYSEPDYERLVNTDVDVAIENTMILHTPKVIEMIEMLDIPVFIEYSSYEPHPLGRTEWIRLFGAMLDREDEADAVFRERTAVMDELREFPNTGKTVAIFLVDTSGKAQVRSGDDYLSRIVEIAGGNNAFDYLDVGDSGHTNVNMTMEEFYATAMDVDYLIYNASGYSSGVDTLEKLFDKSDLLRDCRAVKEGNVWWIGPETYQMSDKLGYLISDIHSMLTGEEGEMTFLRRME